MDQENNKNVKQMETSVFPDTQVETVASKNQLAMPTWLLIAILILTFFLLKKFIYIIDQKRKDK